MHSVQTRYFYTKIYVVSLPSSTLVHSVHSTHNDANDDDWMSETGEQTDEKIYKCEQSGNIERNNEIEIKLIRQSDLSHPMHSNKLIKMHSKIRNTLKTLRSE